MYLLKQGAKPVPERRKRRKVELFQLPVAGVKQPEEQKMEEPMQQPQPSGNRDMSQPPKMPTRNRGHVQTS